MDQTPIPVNEPLLDGNEERYLVECIRTGWISSEGPFVRRFEEEFAAKVDRRHGIAVSNGSVALQVAVGALGIGPGDEVIMPTFTIISCASAVVRSGATPVLVDADPETWNMVPDHIESKITPRTRAIMVVHIYGLPVDLDPILELAGRHGLAVIEDAAEVIGQTYRGRPCGSFGDISTFSFYPNKHVTTGEGGMVLTNDPQLAERCRSLRNLCFTTERRFVHEELGWNFRMSNVQAALGVAQLERLAATVDRKRLIGRRYDGALAGASSFKTPIPSTSYADNIYWVYGIVLNDDVPLDATAVAEQLRSHKIGSRPFFWPMHEQPVFQNMGLFDSERYPVSERIARRGFYIPSGLALTEEQIDRVAESVEEVLQ